MSLNVPKIDDITFAKLVDEALKRIPQIAKEWTDFNVHDPGITFIELLAWLVEMQMFYADQVTERHSLKFLKLLGVGPQPALPASALVTFGVTGDGVVQVESGAELHAKIKDETVPFMIIDRVFVTPTKLQKVIVYSVKSADDGQQAEYKNINVNSDGSSPDRFFYAFGEDPDSKKGSILYLGFDAKFPENGEISFAINLYEDDLPPRGVHDEEPEIIPSSRVVWEYSKLNSWGQLSIICDSTLGFFQSGFVKFKPPSDSEETDIGDGSGAKLFWLRCRIEEAAYEIPPRIQSIRMNTVLAVQMKKFAGQSPEALTWLPNQVFKLKNSPIVPRRLVVKVKEKGKWTEWTCLESLENSEREDEHYTLSLEDSEETGNVEGIIRFGDNKKGHVPTKGVDNIKVVSYIRGEPAEEETFSSDGTKNQTFTLKKVPPILKDVLIRTGDDSVIWHEVADFDASKPESRHYTLDHGKGYIQFGTGCRGRIDVSSNVDAALYYCTEAEKGNIPKESITKIISPIGTNGLTVTNFEDATGGKKAETYEDAVVCARMDLKKPYRAVTLDDFEYLAKATPGLRVAKAKALWTSGVINANGSVKIIVVPYRLPESKNILKGASEGFKKTVCLHLDRHRLLTTRIEVIDPEYVQVSVQATVKVKPLASSDLVKERVIKALEKLFNPLDWPFGKTVFNSVVCAKIEQVDGVDCVQSLTFIAKGNAQHVDGNLKIGENCLTFSGVHLIETVEAQESCEGECK